MARGPPATGQRFRWGDEDADETSQLRCQAGLLRHLPDSGLGNRLFRIYKATWEAPRPKVLALYQQDSP
jgi:hypothetical protein